MSVEQQVTWRVTALRPSTNIDVTQPPCSVLPHPDHYRHTRDSVRVLLHPDHQFFNLSNGRNTLLCTSGNGIKEALVLLFEKQKRRLYEIMTQTECQNHSTECQNHSSTECQNHSTECWNHSTECQNHGTECQNHSTECQNHSTECQKLRHSLTSGVNDYF